SANSTAIKPCAKAPAAWLLIAGRAHPRNKHTRAPARRGRGRQSRRPIPRQSKAAGKRRGASRDKIDSAPSGATLTVAATANRLYPLGSRLDGISVGSWLARKLRQLGDIRRDPPRLLHLIAIRAVNVVPRPAFENPHNARNVSALSYHHRDSLRVSSVP